MKKESTSGVWTAEIFLVGSCRINVHNKCTLACYVLGTGSTNLRALRSNVHLAGLLSLPQQVRLESLSDVLSLNELHEVLTCLRFPGYAPCVRAWKSVGRVGRCTLVMTHYNYTLFFHMQHDGLTRAYVLKPGIKNLSCHKKGLTT